jgi:hypothetical protein
MSISYNSTVKSNRMTVVRDAIDQGSSYGKLEICSASYASVLVSFTLNDPCGTVTTGVLTFSGFPKTVSASNTGTAAIARLVDSDNTVIANGMTVATSSADVILSSVNIIASNNITLNAASITHAT